MVSTLVNRTNNCTTRHSIVYQPTRYDQRNTDSSDCDTLPTIIAERSLVYQRPRYLNDFSFSILHDTNYRRSRYFSRVSDQRLLRNHQRTNTRSLFRKHQPPADGTGQSHTVHLRGPRHRSNSPNKLHYPTKSIFCSGCSSAVISLSGDKVGAVGARSRVQSNRNRDQAGAGWHSCWVRACIPWSPEDGLGCAPVPASSRRLSARTRHRSVSSSGRHGQHPLQPSAGSKGRSLREGYAPPTRVAALRFPRGHAGSRRRRRRRRRLRRRRRRRSEDPPALVHLRALASSSSVSGWRGTSARASVVSLFPGWPVRIRLPRALFARD